MMLLMLFRSQAFLAGGVEVTVSACHLAIFSS
jgi:hypothetical protein